MAADKKNIGGRVRFVLIRKIGAVEPGMEVKPDILRQVLEDLKKE